MGSLLPICRAAADGVLAAFTWLPPLAGLLVLSGSLGVVLLVLFRFLSPQRRLRATKDQMAATVYEMRIFADSPRLVLLAALRSLRWLAQYFVLSLPALVVLFPLVGLLLVRAATHYDYRPLRVSEDALITLTLEQDARGQPIRVTSSSADLEYGGDALAMGFCTSSAYRPLTAIVRGLVPPENSKYVGNGFPDRPAGDN